MSSFTCLLYTSLPEMTMLPDIASLFGIQIDDLFEYSTEKRYESIEKKLQYGRVMTNMEFENEEAFLIREVEACLLYTSRCV